jgi:hypothetical protein
MRRRRNRTSLRWRGRRTSEASVSRLFDTRDLRGASDGALSDWQRQGGRSTAAVERRRPNGHWRRRASGDLGPCDLKGDSDDSQRQRTHLSKSTVPRGMSRLPLDPGVRHAAHAGAERTDRAVLQNAQRRMCVAASVSKLRRSTPSDHAMDRVVQRGATASVTWLCQSPGVPREKSSRGGWTSGEHYTLPLTNQHSQPAMSPRVSSNAMLRLLQNLPVASRLLVV